MANQWLTGEGTPSLGVGQVTDYYRDTVNNLVYYRENAFTWVVVPAFTPNPDGIGTTWLHGNVPPVTGQGSDGDYYYDEVQLIVYRKDGATWVPKGSLDFIGLYGVQWGNGLGAPANTTPLNNLPAGSFYLDVETSDIYFKETSMAWVLKGQLGGGGGGGSPITLVTTLAAVTETDTTSAITPSVIFELATDFGNAISPLAPKESPALTGVPTAPLADPDTNTTQVATTSFVRQEINALTASSVGADESGAAATAESNAKSYAEGLVVGLWDDRGTYAVPIGGVWPTDAAIGSGLDGAILKGDVWSISAAGTLTGGIFVNIGDVIRALVDGAGNTATDWGVTENNLGYTAENSANKATSLASPDNTKYPTTQAVATGLTDNLNLLRYAITTPIVSGSAYAVVGADVSALGNKILKLTNPTTIAVTLPNPNALTPPAVVGDSFSIRQGGAGGITLTGTVSGSNSTAAINTTITLIAESPTSWMVVGG